MEEQKLREETMRGGGTLWPDLPKEVMLWGFRLYAVTDSVLFSGDYISRIILTLRQETRFALDICTFHQNEMMNANMERLIHRILDREQSVLHGRLKVFIVDNGRDYRPSFPNRDDIHISPQAALGSAGGFSYGAKMIMRERETKGFTHLIFMDDDIYFLPEVLERNALFLDCLRPEFSEMLLGGAFMRLDAPEIQHEAGARWNKGKIESVMGGRDMSSIEAVLRNEVEEKTEYMGWWYCCVPLSCIEKRGYPAPIYFHRDDVEFGLRNPLQATLNGICVWHPPLEAKPSSVSKYYDIRNLAAVNAMHGLAFSKWRYLATVWKAAWKEVLRYRRRDARLLLRGGVDFCRGREWVLRHDSGQFYQERKAEGCRFQSISELGAGLERYEKGPWVPCPRPLRLLKGALCNGMFLPGRRCRVIPAYDPPFDLCWRTKSVLNYNSFDHTGYITQRDGRESLRILGELLFGAAFILKNYDQARSTWETVWNEVEVFDESV